MSTKFPSPAAARERQRVHKIPLSRGSGRGAGVRVVELLERFNPSRGNDTLLLSAIPTLSLQAAAAYTALLAGIAITLWAMRRRRAVGWTRR